ncbi:MAG TPA: hypothetical protein VHD56_07625, partial [Tepidisphaeraceae bacterium]|nr:hypothetical protein [Tepidisphaeraceae bacterium]
KLAGVETSPANRLRVFLRRIGGISMIALAVAFYVAIATENPILFSACLIAVFVLLMLIVSLGLYDLRLTSHMRRSQHKEEQL